jgi:serine/threonine protein kinase
MRENLSGVGKESESLTKIEADPETARKVLEESSECGICLESMAKPIVLAGCHHVFCFGCLKQWNDAQTHPMQNYTGYPADLPARTTPQSPTCPLCRQAMPSVSEAPMENALKLMATAGIKQEAAPDECKDLCEKAMEQIDLIFEQDNLSLSEQIQIAVARLEREARSSARLGHPNIVPVLDFGDTGPDAPYLVMQLLEGESLEEALVEGPMTMARAVDVHTQVLDGLSAAHRANVIHRDLKPANIFLSPLGPGRELVRVLDFGLAYLLEDGAKKLTAMGITLGTPAYMPPERILGEAADAR